MSLNDLILHPKYIVPVVPRDQVFTAHSVVVNAGVISAIIPTDEARLLPASNQVELPEHALLPGLINCHGHSAMTLLRGYADDYPLMTWLQSHIWPAEDAFVSADFVRDGTDLALAELLQGGTTTFSDMYFFPDVTAARADRAGLRAQIAFPVLDIATAWATDAETYIAKGLALVDQYRHGDRIEIAFGPHSNYTVSEATLSRVATLAHELDAAIQIHLHETKHEVLMSVENIGERPIAQLSRLGLLSPRTQCVHMTALSDNDIDTLTASGAQVVHCPRSNMKLASGICPTQKLLARGINVALGTDGAASNNRLSMLSELQFAALLGKVSSEDATAISAMDALEMATIRGARALGYEDLIGSIEVGKRADIIAIDMNSTAMQPVHNVISQLVYATSGSEVTHSWVDGRPLLQERQLTTIDVQAVTRRAEYWREKLSQFDATAS